MSNTNLDFYQHWRLIYHRRRDVRIYTNGALVLLGLSLLIVVAIQPTFQTILDLRQKIKNSRILLDQMNFKIQRLNKIQTDYLSINDKIGLIKNVFPSQASPAYLGRIVKIYASKNNLRLKTLNLSSYQWPLEIKTKSRLKNKKTKLVITYRAGVTLEGNYNDLVNFFKDVESLQTMVYIPSFNIQSKKDLITLNTVLILENKN